MAFRRHSNKKAVDSGRNPNRTADLYQRTSDGYLIAHDIASQYEYAQEQSCVHCGCRLNVIAQINRSFQGLNELVTACPNCGKNASFIFDISNQVYQNWLAERLGDLYVRNYDGAPRQPHRNR